MSLIKRRLVAPASGGDIERIKRIKAPNNMTLALGNQGGAIAVSDVKILVTGSLDNQADLADEEKCQSLKAAFTAVSNTTADLDDRLETLEALVPKTKAFGLAPAFMLSSIPGSSISALQGEKFHYFPPVFLVPGSSYQVNFGYTGLNNNYSSLPSSVTNPSPQPLSTDTMCRNYYVICRVHRGTQFNHLANVYATMNFSRGSGSATFYNANETVTAVFRASTLPPVYTGGATPEVGFDNVYTVGFYVRNQTYTGGTGADAGAILKFESIWYRLEEQPVEPP
jgi:hypothetical protein